MCRRSVKAAVDLVLELDLFLVDFPTLTRHRYLFKSLFEVRLDIPDVLNPNRKPDHVICDNLTPIFDAEVFVRGRSWVKDEGLRVTETVKVGKLAKKQQRNEKGVRTWL